MKNLILSLLAVFSFLYETAAQTDSLVYDSEELKIESLSDNVYKHISFLNTDEYGKVACNGLLYIDGDEAVIFDTPTNNLASAELINWVNQDLKKEMIAVITTHFHEDCLGGIDAFKKAGIGTYAEEKTIKIAENMNLTSPEFGFSDSLKLQVGDKKVDLRYFGSGHTHDNIVAYIPAENVLFGGCLLKALGSGKGNLQDADTLQWPETIREIKAAYPEIKTVVPGHGKHGGPELLNYTIELFGKD